jgi:cation-transporting ATPase E
VPRETSAATDQPTARADEQLPAGLTTAEAADRTERGLTNRAPNESSRTLAEIVRANVFTRFNAILGTLLAIILTIGPIQDALFGIVLIVNTAIGIAQEWRAKQTLDRLSLLSAAKATVVRDGARHEVAVDDIVQDDVVELTPGSQIVADGEVLEADALEVDESLLTGESVAEAKDVGGQVMSGSFVTAGRGWHRADKVGAAAYANDLAAQAKRFSLVRSELRQGTDQILRWVTWLIFPVAILLIFSQMRSDETFPEAIRGSVAGIGSMIPEGLVLLTSVAFAASVIRLGKRKVLIQELAAIEVLARVDVVCIDKTGTITEPVMEVVALEPLAGATEDQVKTALGGLAWADPEPNASMSALAKAFASPGWTTAWRVAFSSARRFSASGFGGNGDWALGAPDGLLPNAVEPDAAKQAAELVDEHSRNGQRVLLLARINGQPADAAAGPPANEPVAVIALEERIRDEAGQTLSYFRDQGVTVKVISGDDPRTVGAVATRVGIDGSDHPLDARELLHMDDDELADAVEATAVFGRVAPHQKQSMVKALQSRGHVVAMTGDGVNDVLALKEADLGLAMGSGSAASRAVAPVVLLNSSFASLPPMLAEGRQVIANVERVANLFLTKTVYATLLALAIGVAQLPFPFLPRHLTIVSSLTIGIPAFFLALAPNDRRYVPGFVGRVLRFAVPAGSVAAAATFGAYVLARDTAGVSQAEARTVATITLFLVALWVLAMLARPTSPFRATLVLSMAGAFVVVLAVPGMREFFGLELPSSAMIGSAIGIAAMAGVALEFGWQAAGWVRHVHHVQT